MEIAQRKVSTETERLILIGLISSDAFLEKAAGVLDLDCFVLPWFKIVAGWCIDYFKEYSKAPGLDIEHIFEDESRNGLEPDLADLIEKFLDRLFKEYEEDAINPDYLFDRMRKHMNSIKLESLGKDLIALAGKGQVDDATALIASYSVVEKTTETSYIDPFDDTQAVYDAFELSSESLFTVPGALGELLNEEFKRKCLVGFQAPRKSGKTWFAQFLARRANGARCNVAFFQCGDLSREQQVRRIAIAEARKSDRAKYCGNLVVPCMDCAHNQDDSCNKVSRVMDRQSIYDEVEVPDEKKKKKKVRMSYEDLPDYIPCTVCRKENPKDYKPATWFRTVEVGDPLTPEEAIQALNKFKERRKGYKMRLSCHPMESLTLSKMNSVLDAWENNDGFVADVIIVDYVEIMDSEDKKLSPRDQDDAKWKGLRKMADERNCVVIPFTQAKWTFGEESQTTDNFSENSRKMNHVTGFYAMNQTPEEKEQYVIRFGPLTLREEDFSLYKQVVVLQALGRGMPYVDSFWTRKTIKPRKA